MNYQTFENNLLETCNKVANMMHEESIRTNNYIEFDKCFEMAKKLTFATYKHILEIK